MNGRLWGHLSSGDSCRVRARDAGAPRARRGTLSSDAKRARNRRLAHMRRTLDRDGYFDVDAMRARAPALFDEIVGVRVVEADEGDAEANEGTMGERILARERAREFREREEARRARELGEEVEREAEAAGRATGAEEDAVASRFGEAFARTSRNAFWKDMSTEKVSDATWRKAMFQGWGEREEPTTKTKTTAPTNADETSGAKNETFIVDVDDFRSSHGRSQTYISQEEYVERAEYFERVMREQFLAGGDEDFDYAAVDGDDGLDEHWRKERDQDAEDRYFDED